jgi:hypothetical protein
MYQYLFSSIVPCIRFDLCKCNEFVWKFRSFLISGIKIYYIMRKYSSPLSQFPRYTMCVCGCIYVCMYVYVCWRKYFTKLRCTPLCRFSLRATIEIPIHRLYLLTLLMVGADADTEVSKTRHHYFGEDKHTHKHNTTKSRFMLCLVVFFLFGVFPRHE